MVITRIVVRVIWLQRSYKNCYQEEKHKTSKIVIYRPRCNDLCLLNKLL